MITETTTEEKYTEEKYIDVDGLNIRYITAVNNDPPLVLLHGVGESVIDWSWVLPELAT
jgi:pimeloyl-ACP methyl ester carboxylesterase